MNPMRIGGGAVVELVYQPMTHHLLGLSWTRSGYGSKIPTPYMARVEGRSRRVYSTVWSNSGTAWITVKGKKEVLW